jgi:hypothetical protein
MNLKPPVWAWLVGLAPWAWVIPMNQYFWDDWIFQHERAFGWHVEYWITLGAKHFLNPVLFPPLLTLGAWSFHLVMCIATMLGARALIRVVSKIPGFPPGSAKWAGPIFLALPVFHARFSAATIEYVLAICFLLLGWSQFLLEPTRLRTVSVVGLLTYAVGVPTLVVLFPIMWLHGSLVHSAGSSRSAIRPFLRRNLFVIAIPLVFMLIFATILNSRGKYQIALGSIFELARAAGVLGSMTVLALWLGRKRGLSWGTGRAMRYVAPWIVLLSLAPYFAVGYNPLMDFLPWRFRSEVVAALWTWLPRTFLLLLATAALIIGYIDRSNPKGRRAAVAVFLSSSALVIAHSRLGLIDWDSRLPYIVWPLALVLAAVALTAAMVRQLGGGTLARMWGKIGIIVAAAAMCLALGPMDWESRHWLVAWPALVVLLLAWISESGNLSDRLARCSLVILAAASATISSEYFVDAMKQRAIIRAAVVQIDEYVSAAMDDSGELSVVLYENPSVNDLNARYRWYRPYEWWGLLTVGLDAEPNRIRVFDEKDVGRASADDCENTREAVALKPVVLSGRREALTRFRVRVDLNPNLIDVCDLDPVDGWPRQVK